MSKSIQIAPKYGLYRTVKAADSGDVTDVNQGINTAHYRVANIQILPGVSDEPAVEVLFWSTEVNKFISGHIPVAFAALAAGVAWEESIETNGRIIFIRVTGTLTTGNVKVLVSGYELDHSL